MIFALALVPFALALIGMSTRAAAAAS